jgi:hypothetical protein
MSVCPWCKAQNPTSADKCAKCGKRAAEHPSIAGRDVATLGDFGSGQSEPPPALDIELAGSLPAHRGSSDVGAGSGGLKSFGDDWGDEEPAKGGANLDLADAPVPSSTRGKSARTAPVVAAPPPATTTNRSGTSQKLPAIAPERSLADDRPSFDIDRYEILALADYGAEPKSILQAIPYAVRVQLRRRELRRALASVRAALVEAEKRRDDRMIELGELLRPHVQTNESLRRFAGSLDAAEKTRQTRSSALAEIDASFKSRVAGIDQQIAALDAPLTAAKAEVATKAKLAADAESLRQKHEARRKRVEIDVRNAQLVMQRPDATADQKRQAQATISAATQEKEVRAQEEKIATQAAQEAEARAATARGAQADVEGKIAALRGQRRDAERDYARQAQIRGEGIDAASKEVRDALLEIGRATAKADVGVEGAEIRRKSIAESEANVKRLQLDLEKHLRALDAANADMVNKGTITIVVIVVVLVGAFIAWRALRTNPYMQDAPTAPAPTK